ncbi:uncharacterized protein LOC116939771 [Petromyzon marinus]|uniref:uncharacterized protein LOC116939771 n=1 Tax=Petromyzon marinus TaxID=7757 RepID=UPI003F6FD698
MTGPLGYGREAPHPTVESTKEGGTPLGTDLSGLPRGPSRPLPSPPTRPPLGGADGVGGGALDCAAGVCVTVAPCKGRDGAPNGRTCAYSWLTRSRGKQGRRGRPLAPARSPPLLPLWGARRGGRQDPRGAPTTHPPPTPSCDPPGAGTEASAGDECLRPGAESGSRDAGGDVEPRACSGDRSVEPHETPPSMPSLSSSSSSSSSSSLLQGPVKDHRKVCGDPSGRDRSVGRTPADSEGSEVTVASSSARGRFASLHNGSRPHASGSDPAMTSTRPLAAARSQPALPPLDPRGSRPAAAAGGGRRASSWGLVVLPPRVGCVVTKLRGPPAPRGDPRDPRGRREHAAGTTASRGGRHLLRPEEAEEVKEEQDQMEEVKSPPPLDLGSSPCETVEEPGKRAARGRFWGKGGLLSSFLGSLRRRKGPRSCEGDSAIPQVSKSSPHRLTPCASGEQPQISGAPPPPHPQSSSSAAASTSSSSSSPSAAAAATSSPSSFRGERETRMEALLEETSSGDQELAHTWPRRRRRKKKKARKMKAITAEANEEVDSEGLTKHGGVEGEEEQGGEGQGEGGRGHVNTSRYPTPPDSPVRPPDPLWEGDPIPGSGRDSGCLTPLHESWDTLWSELHDDTGASTEGAVGSGGSADEGPEQAEEAQGRLEGSFAETPVRDAGASSSVSVCGIEGVFSATLVYDVEGSHSGALATDVDLEVPICGTPHFDLNIERRISETPNNRDLEVSHCGDPSQEFDHMGPMFGAPAHDPDFEGSLSGTSAHDLRCERYLPVINEEPLPENSSPRAPAHDLDREPPLSVTTDYDLDIEVPTTGPPAYDRDLEGPSSVNHGGREPHVPLSDLHRRPGARSPSPLIAGARETAASGMPVAMARDCSPVRMRPKKHGGLRGLAGPRLCGLQLLRRLQAKGPRGETLEPKSTRRGGRLDEEQEEQEANPVVRSMREGGVGTNGGGGRHGGDADGLGGNIFENSGNTFTEDGGGVGHNGQGCFGRVGGNFESNGFRDNRVRGGSGGVGGSKGGHNGVGGDVGSDVFCEVDGRFGGDGSTDEGGCGGGDHLGKGSRGEPGGGHGRGDALAGGGGHGHIGGDGPSGVAVLDGGVPGSGGTDSYVQAAGVGGGGTRLFPGNGSVGVHGGKPARLEGRREEEDGDVVKEVGEVWDAGRGRETRGGYDDDEDDGGDGGDDEDGDETSQEWHLRRDSRISLMHVQLEEAWDRLAASLTRDHNNNNSITSSSKSTSSNSSNSSSYKHVVNNIGSSCYSHDSSSNHTRIGRSSSNHNSNNGNSRYRVSSIRDQWQPQQQQQQQRRGELLGRVFYSACND